MQPSMCIGDYNSYLKPTDKARDNPVTGYMVKDFEECCVQAGLSVFPSMGLYYTWWNGHTWCKLDRVLLNQEWIVSVKEPRERPICLFRYYNMWASHPEFQGIVQEVWSEETPSTNKFALCRKMKILKHPLKQLNKREFGIFLRGRRRSG